MQILDVTQLTFTNVKIIRYKRYSDERGFFTETYRKSEFQSNPLLTFIKDAEFTQTNVSYSKKNVIRGLHFQWDPPMGKLIRTISGRMIDLFMDIRVGSETFGKIAAFDMVSHVDQDYNQWIWIPPGFAHGCVFLEDTFIEYFCTAEYNPAAEGTISPFAPDIDWSTCDAGLKEEIDMIMQNTPNISDKDKKGLVLSAWKSHPESVSFKM